MYIKTVEDGAKRAQVFCPDCELPISAGPEKDSSLQYVSIRVGLMKQKFRLKPSKHIWPALLSIGYRSFQIYQKMRRKESSMKLHITIARGRAAPLMRTLEFDGISDETHFPFIPLWRFRE